MVAKLIAVAASLIFAGAVSAQPVPGKLIGSLIAFPVGANVPVALGGLSTSPLGPGYSFSWFGFRAWGYNFNVERTKECTTSGPTTTSRYYAVDANGNNIFDTQGNHAIKVVTYCSDRLGSAYASTFPTLVISNGAWVISLPSGATLTINNVTPSLPGDCIRGPFPSYAIQTAKGTINSNPPNDGPLNGEVCIN